MTNPRETPDPEDGSAVVEFLAGTLLLLIPVVYLILTFASVQAAMFAAESAARESGRIYSRAPSEIVAQERSAAATHLAFSDHGITVSPREAVTVSCEHRPCLTPGAGIHVRVSIDVPLPLIPDVLSSRMRTSVTVTAESFATVDRFGG